MDGKSRATVVFRAGTVLVAICLAFGLVSYFSNLTVTGYSTNNWWWANRETAPAGTYVVLSTIRVTSPQQMYFLNVSSVPVGAEVYLLSTNSTAMNVWISEHSGISLTNLSYYGPQDLSWFTAYIQSHGQEVLGRYNTSGRALVLRYFTSNMGPLMVVAANGDSHSPLNLTSYWESVGVPIDPALGFSVAGILAVAGGALVATGLILKRRMGTGRFSPSGRR